MPVQPLSSSSAPRPRKDLAPCGVKGHVPIRSDMALLWPASQSPPGGRARGATGAKQLFHLGLLREGGYLWCVMGWGGGMYATAERVPRRRESPG
eukprot:scaffold761_cov146-Isochrysis_galbana.AAC.3